MPAMGPSNQLRRFTSTGTKLRRVAILAASARSFDLAKRLATDRGQRLHVFHRGAQGQIDLEGALLGTTQAHNHARLQQQVLHAFGLVRRGRARGAAAPKR